MTTTNWRNMRTTVRTTIAAYALLALAIAATALPAQQVPDKTFQPPVPRPAFAEGKGLRLCLDEAHHNFHTLDNRFWAFGELARRDGYRVAPSRTTITAASLGACDLFVISNAQWSDIEWSEYPTPTPSAFTVAEIAALKAWVENGGRLLLIADHMPLAGAATELAAAFGATFTDGFAYPVVPAGATDAKTSEIRGRVAFFGEAAMFSAQVAGPQKRPMGMNAELAEQNPQFALNTLHWLSGVIEPG